MATDISEWDFKPIKGNRINSVLALLSETWTEIEGSEKIDWLLNPLIRKNIEFGFRIKEDKRHYLKGFSKTFKCECDIWAD